MICIAAVALALPAPVPSHDEIITVLDPSQVVGENVNPTDDQETFNRIFRLFRLFG